MSEWFENLWPGLVGLFFVWCGVTVGIRELRAGVAHDGEYRGARRFRRSERPVVFWSLVFVDLLAIVYGAYLIAVTAQKLGLE